MCFLQNTSGPRSTPLKDGETAKDLPRVRAICDYQGHRKTVLSFNKDDEAKLISKSPTGWWCVNLRGRCGWVPGNYWQVIEVSHMTCHMIGHMFNLAISLSTILSIKHCPNEAALSPNKIILSFWIVFYPAEGVP